MIPHSRATRTPAWLALSGAVLVGILTALQARINGELGFRLQDGFTAAVISFGSGFAILLVLSAALPAGRRGVRTLVAGVRGRTIPWWMLAGGAAGAFTVLTQSLAVATIGLSMFTVGFVAGQAVGGLVLDRAGYGPAGVVAVTMGRVGGGALTLVAVAVSFGSGGIGGIPLWMLLGPLIAGAAVAWQQATNGRLRQRVGTPLTATLVNFAGGTLVLAVIAAIRVAIAGAPASLPSDPWLYLGGSLGVVYIFLSAALVATTGVLLLGLGSVMGLLLTSVVADALWPAAASPGIVQEIVIIVIALSGVVVAAVPWRRLQRRRRPR